MELYAAMVDNLDENIGRLLNYLKETGQYGNTLIIFMSDNGAAGEDYYSEASIRPYLNPYYSNEYENMGSESSLVSYGPPWAEAGSAAFRYYKEYTTNGGIIAPMILSGPGVSRKNTIHHGLVTVMDLAPTIYQSAGVSYPEKWEGNRLYPLTGTSLLPFASGQDGIVHPPDYGFGMEHSGYAMYRKGSWKITNSVRPFGTCGKKPRISTGNFLRNGAGMPRKRGCNYPAEILIALAGFSFYCRAMSGGFVFFFGRQLIFLGLGVYGL